MTAFLLAVVTREPHNQQMEKTVSIRSATNLDRASIEQLVFTVLRAYGLEPSPESTDADLQDVEQHYLETGGAFDVLVDDSGLIVGTVAVHRTDDSLCELRKMYLHPDFRGNGLGQLMMEHALSRAKELGFERMWLETADSLTEAHGLYQKFGFVPFDAPHQSDRCDFALCRDL